MADHPAHDAFDSEELLALARVALERNDLEGALAKVKKALGAADPSAEAIGVAARVYAQLGLYTRAEKLYEQFLAKHPKAALERFQLGMTRFDAGRPGDALEVWNALLKEQPLHPPALFYSALALTKVGKTSEARAGLDMLFRSIPADNLYFGRGRELLQSIESGTAAAQAASASARPADPYRTTH